MWGLFGDSLSPAVRIPACSCVSAATAASRAGGSAAVSSAHTRGWARSGGGGRDESDSGK